MKKMIVLLVLANLLFPSAVAANERAADQLAVKGMRFVDVINTQDADAFAEVVDMEMLAKKVVEGMDFSAKDERAFVSGFSDAKEKFSKNAISRFSTKRAKANLLRSAVQPFGSEHLVRLAYFDAAGESDGYEYLRLVMSESGRLFDWYSYAQGSYLSDTVRQLAISTLQGGDILDKLFGRTVPNSEALAVMKSFFENMRNSNFSAAADLLQKFPDEFKDTPAWAVQRVNVASNIGEERYREALRFLAEKHGDRQEFQFLLIDHYFFLGDYGRAVGALERFEQSVVEDGATNLLKCNVHFVAKDFDAAKRACQRSIDLEPEVETPWWMLVEVGRSTSDVALTLTTLSGYEEQFDTRFDPEKLVEIESYRWLKPHKAFAEWAAQH